MSHSKAQGLFYLLNGLLITVSNLIFLSFPDSILTRRLFVKCITCAWLRQLEPSESFPSCVPTAQSSTRRPLSATPGSMSIVQRTQSTMMLLLLICWTVREPSSPLDWTLMNQRKISLGGSETRNRSQIAIINFICDDFLAIDQIYLILHFTIKSTGI